MGCTFMGGMLSLPRMPWSHPWMTCRTPTCTSGRRHNGCVNCGVDRQHKVVVVRASWQHRWHTCVGRRAGHRQSHGDVAMQLARPACLELQRPPAIAAVKHRAIRQPPCVVAPAHPDDLLSGHPRFWHAHLRAVTINHMNTASCPAPLDVLVLVYALAHCCGCVAL